MRQEVIVSSLLRRVRQRSNLLLVLLVGGLFSLFRGLQGSPEQPRFELLLPFVLLFAQLALSPVPWQWTGGEEPRAGLARGFLQALGFDAAWVGLLLLGLHFFAPAPPPRPEPPPPMAREGAARMPPRPRPTGPGMGLGLVNVGFAVAFGWVFAEKEASEVRATAMAELLRRARSRALQNQLRPHVLYNALNSLSELVHDDPLAAEDMIARLADLYRMLAVHGETDRVALGQERRLVEAYLAMEQMRLGDRLRVRWDWPEGADEVVLPPLFLQPMVENAIKHGISPSDEGGELRIACALEGEAVSLRVGNTGAPLASPGARGLGLGNLEARLAMWNVRESDFSLGTRDGWTIAELRWAAEEGA